MRELSLIRFGKDDIANTVAGLSDAEIDKLAFGALQLDGRCRILKYNAAEGEISGLDPLPR